MKTIVEERTEGKRMRENGKKMLLNCMIQYIEVVCQSLIVDFEIGLAKTEYFI